MLPGATRFVGLPPWVRIVPDGRGGEAVLWPHPHGAGGEDGGGYGSEGNGEEEGYWGGPHVYDDVGHPGSFLGGGGGEPSGGRRSTGLVRGEGAIHRGDSSSSGVWGEEGGQLGIGMTQARQREIQEAVVSMMGGGGGNSTSRAGRPPSPFVRGGGGAGGGGGRNGRDERGGDAEVAAAAVEWACELCTLINAGRRRRCEACWSAKPPVPRSPRANNGDNGGGGARSPPRLLSPVPPPGAVGEGGGAGEGQGQQVPPEGAVLAGPDAGGEDAKEDETEEAKAGDPDV